MSNLEKIPNRLDEIFSESELPDPEPTPKAPLSAASEKKADVEIPTQSKLSSAEANDHKSRLGWEDYLNAIDRDDKIGFSYNDGQIVPLATAVDTDDGTEAVEVPLQIGSELLGALQLEGRDDWDSEDVDLISTIAQQVSQHVENLRLLEQAEQYRSEAEDATRQLTRDGWEEYLQNTESAVSGFVYDSNRVKPIEASSLVSNPAVVNVSHDLIVRDTSIGQLTVTEADQDPETVSNLLDTISERLSTQIESLRLLEETERGRQQLDKRAAELETVAKVSTAAATILDPTALLQSVVDLTSYSFGLYHSSVYLLSDDGTELRLAAGSGKIGQKMVEAGYAIPLDSQSVVAQAAQSYEVEIVADFSDNPDYTLHPDLPETKSEMAIPMIVADQLIGIVAVEANEANRFGQDDEQTYKTLASQTAVALRNAQLYAEQMATVARLKELDNMKSAFLANMSHELRTPLNSILGFTQVILEGLDGPLTEYMEDDLGLIEKNGKHLLNLINDVLDMARIEAGRVSFYIESVNLPDLLDDVLRTNSPMAREKSLSLAVKNNLVDNQTIMADSVRLRQVLINVVGNALKFTHDGSITVFADYLDENKIQVRIKDTGIGVPPDKLESIYEAFSQVDTSTTRKVGGTGLGLPISRRLVEMHGGRMWAESSGVEGEGMTTFIELLISGPEEKPTEVEV
jgi:signal transduction histidine kinase